MCVTCVRVILGVKCMCLLPIPSQVFFILDIKLGLIYQLLFSINNFFWFLLALKLIEVSYAKIIKNKIKRVFYLNMNIDYRQSKFIGVFPSMILSIKFHIDKRQY